MAWWRRGDVRNPFNVELDAGYTEMVTLCCRGLDTLHANRTPHHQMKALICSEMLLSLITVAMALTLSSLYALSTFSLSPSLYASVSCSPLAPCLVNVYVLNVFPLPGREVLSLKNGKNGWKKKQDYACPRFRQNRNGIEQHYDGGG